MKNVYTGLLMVWMLLYMQHIKTSSTLNIAIEAVKTNIHGAENIINAAIDKGVKSNCIIHR